MRQKFIENGYEIVEFEEKADIYIINTCTVTNMSDRKSRQIIRRVKDNNKCAIVVVTGCYAQVAKEELYKIGDIDIVLGNIEKKDVVKTVEDFIKTNRKENIVSDIMKERYVIEFEVAAYTEKTRAVVKIQDGCDRFCSYCIIPYARGRVRSRSIRNVTNEISEISKKGIKEVIITGIHIASYGKDLKGNISLIDLLKEINKIEGIKRIRLGSIEPTLIDEKFIEELVKLEKICDHFHLSLQSGCDETLKRMNRRYTTKEFENCTNLIKNNYPKASLTTDIIVGFPGETEKEFLDTYQYLDKIDFYKMHIFKYSQRKGTKAAMMENQIDGNTKELRSNKLIKLSNKKETEHNASYIENIVSVLLEEREGEFIKGHTTNYINVYVKTDKEGIENEIVNVKIRGIYKDGLVGEIQRVCNENVITM